MRLRRTEGAGRECGAARPRALAAVAVSGLMLAGGCAPAMSQVPDTVAVREYLMEAPVGVAEAANLPGAGQRVGGRIADCKGKEGCLVPLVPGDVLLSAGFMPEQDGRMEVSVCEIGDGGVVLRRRAGFGLSEARNETRMFKFGEGARLFETDVSIRVDKDAKGIPFASIQ